MFESFDVPNSKYDAMKSNFAYLCDLSFDNDEHFIEPYMSIFDIHSINTEPFNMDTDENLRTSHISKDVTPEENENEARKVMTDIHEGVCGLHINGTMLTKKIMRQGFF